MQRFDSTGVMMNIIDLLMQGSDSGKHGCPTPKFLAYHSRYKTTVSHFRSLLHKHTASHSLINHREQFKLLNRAVSEKLLLLVCD